jgi:uncharacterized coiled-coil DUF342 family protein
MTHENLRKIIRELIENELEEISTTGGVGGFLTPYAFKGKKGKNKSLGIYKKMGFTPVTENLNEASYRKFKSKISETTNRSKIRKALGEMKKSIKEMDTLIDFSNKLKEEMGGDRIHWESVRERISEFSSQLNEMQKKLKTLYK